VLAINLGESTIILLSDHQPTQLLLALMGLSNITKDSHANH
jgi:hypothetical protein